MPTVDEPKRRDLLRISSSKKLQNAFDMNGKRNKIYFTVPAFYKSKSNYFSSFVLKFRDLEQFYLRFTTA